MKMRTADRGVDAGVWMRTAIALAIAVVVVLAMIAGAKAQTTLPEITVSPPSQPPRIQDQLDHKEGGNGKSGADGKSGDSRSLDQLNHQLKRKVDETNPVLNNPPLDARSGDTKTGVINIPGVQQQYGRNFGNSVIPYRPGTVPAPPIGQR